MMVISISIPGKERPSPLAPPTVLPEGWGETKLVPVEGLLVGTPFVGGVTVGAPLVGLSIVEASIVGAVLRRVPLIEAWFGSLPMDSGGRGVLVSEAPSTVGEGDGG